MKNKILIIFLIAFHCFTAQTSQKAQFQNKQQEILHRIKNPSKDYVLAVAHRGVWTQAPENSLLAVQKAIEMGFDIVEIDVRLTKDHQLVLMHDETVDRTTNGKGLVKDYTLEEIKKLRLKNAIGVQWKQQQIPTLEEVMLLAKGKVMINLDKTENKTVQEAYEVLKKTGTIDHAIFKGNDPVEVMREKYGKLMDSIIYMPKVWYSLPDIPLYIKNYQKDINPPIYEMIFDSTTSPVFQQIKSMNKNKISVLAIALWDELCAGYSDEKALMQGEDKVYGWLIENGANAIMTDNPSGLLNYLRKRNLHD